MSYIARMVYSYKDRYVLTATFRADGSSKFSKENRFSYFPSFSAAWRMSEEKFMKNLNFISNLKLRAGWGMVGNQGLSPYQTLTTYSSMYTATPIRTIRYRPTASSSSASSPASCPTGNSNGRPPSSITWVWTSAFWTTGST